MKKWLAMLLAAALLLTGCGTAASTADPASQATDTATKTAGQPDDDWTVMLYLCGTDLESAYSMATLNLAEVAQAEPSDSVNFVFQTGGTQEWHADEEESVGLEIRSDVLQRYQYDADGFALVDEQPLANMASTNTLAEFISWGAQAYPAKHYAVILWDHGGGTYGLIYDEIHDSMMSVDQLGMAMKKSGVHLDLMVMDACLMATLETAQDLAPYVDYFAAAEETMPGEGMDYTGWLQLMYDEPQSDAAAIGSAMVAGVREKYEEAEYISDAHTSTFSLIDLSRIDAVADAFAVMFREAGALLDDPDQYQNFAYATSLAESYAYPEMKDLADFASRAKGNGISAAAADAVTAAVEDAVVDFFTFDGHSNGRGLTFYADPSGSKSILNNYARLCKIPEYLAYLDAVNMSWAAPAWVYEQTAEIPEAASDVYLPAAEVTLTRDGHLQLTITRGLQGVNEVSYQLFWVDPDTGEEYSLGRNFDVDGSFSTGVFQDRFDGKWPSLNGIPCQMKMVRQTEKYNLYNIPAYIPDEDMEGSISFRVGYVYDTPLDQPVENGADPLAGVYQLYGIWEEYDNDQIDLPSRSSSPMDEIYGYECYLIWGRSLLEQNKTILDENFIFEDAVLPDGVYTYEFVITDVFGGDHTMDGVTVLVEDGEATFVMDDEDAAA
ncbi:MAG: clostripain-related cysteine peptidase [Faecalibacterium sp.]